MTKAELKADLTAALNKCKQININGANYFGEVSPKDKEGVITVSNAIESAEALRPTVISWIKAKTTGRLTKLTVSGDTNIVSKELSEEDKEVMEVTIITATSQISNAVAKLQADSVK